MDTKILKKLFSLTNKSLKINDFPVAAIIFDENNNIISTAYNKRNKTKKTTDHAEIIAIEKANKKKKNWKLENLKMVVTLEPCEMCKTVIKESRLKEVYYIVPRYTFKKQYKCTIFSALQYSSPELELYLQNIKHFFDSKR